MFYHLEETTSTIDEARDARYVHGDVIQAERQTAGRGQRGHKWLSPGGENLLFSAVLCPTFLHANEQFRILQVVALALTDTFEHYGLDTRIKWTNDIYAGDRKMVGILIEHSLSGGRMARTIAGIGINVNQTAFDPALPNPVSLAQAGGRKFNRSRLLETFLVRCLRRYAQLERGEKETLQHAYRERMYRLGEQHPYRLPDGTLFQAAIEGVLPSGELILRHADGTRHEYLFREIEFVIAGKQGNAGPAEK